MKDSPEYGSILFVTLGMLSICSLLVGLTIALIVSSYTISKETSLGNLARSTSLENLVRQEYPNKSIQRLACVNSGVSKNQVSVEDCQVIALPLSNTQYIDKHSKSFPILDLEYYLKQLASCLTITPSNNGLLLGKYSSTPGSIFSRQDCVPNQSSIKSFVTKDNIKSMTPLTLSKDNLLLAAGRIELTDQIKLESDALIIAGGDLAIKSLRNDSKSIMKVTLISLSGSVIVENIEGPLSLFVISWEGAAVPSTPFIPPYRIPSTLNAFLISRNFWD